MSETAGTGAMSSGAALYAQPMNVEQKGAPSPPPPVKTPPTLPEDIGVAPGKQEKEWLRGPLSRSTSYRIIVSGDMGANEVRKLIRALEAQAEILNDDDV